MLDTDAMKQQERLREQTTTWRQERDRMAKVIDRAQQKQANLQKELEQHSQEGAASQQVWQQQLSTIHAQNKRKSLAEQV